MPSSLRRPSVVLVAAALAVVLCACQVRVEVAVDADVDGAGVVTVGLGLEQGALDRLGDPTAALQLDDLRQAGWAVTGPEGRDDGFTWFEASKAFADQDELALVLAEVGGPDGPVRDVAIAEGETDTSRTYRLTGTVDLSPGLGAYADPELVSVLGEGTLASLVADVEAAEGRSVEEMFDVRVTATVGDEAQVLAPRLGDPPQALDVTEEVAKPTSILVWVVAGVAIAAALAALLVVARRRFRHVGR